LIIGVVVGAAVLCLLLVAGFIFWRRRSSSSAAASLSSLELSPTGGTPASPTGVHYSVTGESNYAAYPGNSPVNAAENYDSVEDFAKLVEGGVEMEQNYDSVEDFAKLVESP
jgi:hypothetical protein